MTTSELSVQQARDVVRTRTTRGNVIALAITALMAVVTVPYWEAVALIAPSLALASVVLLMRLEPGLRTRLLWASTVVGAGTLVWAALELVPAGSAGIAITMGVWIARRQQHRLMLAMVAVMAIAGVSALALVTDPDGGERIVLLMTVVAGAWIMTILESDDQSRVLEHMERAKDAERELSILRERSRFAADLHDIQGHTLHVIKLKAAVAAKLQHTDPDRTAAELEAIGRLTAETIEQARHLANSTHALVLASELANAVELFEAAGIDTQVEGSATGVESHQDELALTLREATTNILRHARPSRVSIVVRPDGLVISNDGAARPQDAPQRGLATLRRRVGEGGGVLDTEQQGETFTLSVSFEQGHR